MKSRATHRLIAAVTLALACNLISISVYSGTIKNHKFASDPLATPSASFQPRAATYHYQVQWRGSTAGDITFTMDPRDQHYTLSLRGESNEHIDRLYRVRYQAISQLSASPFLPLRAVYRENVQNDRKHFNTEFHADGRITAVRDRNRPGRDPSQSTVTFTPDTFAVDALSGLALMMKTDWQEGKHITFETIFGQDRFEATLRCVGRARMDVMNSRREAWVIALDMREINEDQGKQRQAETAPIDRDAVRIYLSNDVHREILRLTANSPLGEVHVRLRGFTPLRP